ncbi:MAG: lysophospholipid acyltransferase family protein [Candidatus Tantalella remota]|nr:lysophospholipid acyltransferase family protein [Candidatus Tantalella remota]
MKKLLKFIHSVIWWIDWLVILSLGLFFDAVVWPGNREMYRKSEQFWAWTLMKIGGITLEVEGQENLPEDETVVYMPNHQSDLDWPIIFRVVPGQYLFLAKQELFNAPVFGAYMKLQEYIPIERSNIRKSFKTYQTIITLLKSGNSIVIFPEGTRSFDHKLGKFKPSSFSILQDTKVRVVPIAINGSTRIQRRGSKSITPGKVKIKILPPVSFEDLYPLENKAFSAAAASRIREQLLTVLDYES